MKPGDAWFVLSTRHGLLKPDQVADPEDQNFKTMTLHARRQWAQAVLDALLNDPQCPLAPADRIVIFAPMSMARFLLEPLQARQLQVILPMRETPSEEELAWLQKAADDRR